MVGILAADADFMIHCLKKLNVFGQEVYLTTTHVSLLIICVGLVLLALAVRFTLRDTEGKPGRFQNAIEMAIEMLDGMVKGSMGKSAVKYQNYISSSCSFSSF